jgi:tellurite resistance protein
MVVKLKIDQFTGGDMTFSVRRRFRPNAAYYKQFYTSGALTLEALNEIKKSKGTKLSDEYFSVKQEAQVDNLDDSEYILEEIKEGVKESVKEDIKEKVKEDIKEEVKEQIKEEAPKTFLDALTAAYTRNAPQTSILKRKYTKRLPELTIEQKTLDTFFKENPNEIDTKQKTLDTYVTTMTKDEKAIQDYYKILKEEGY